MEPCDSTWMKREHPALEISSLFSIFVGHFCPSGSGPGFASLAGITSVRCTVIFVECRRSIQPIQAVHTHTRLHNIFFLEVEDVALLLSTTPGLPTYDMIH